eukprot:2127985-Prymnesium_polylepis.1
MPKGGGQCGLAPPRTHSPRTGDSLRSAPPPGLARHTHTTDWLNKRIASAPRLTEGSFQSLNTFK